MPRIAPVTRAFSFALLFAAVLTGCAGMITGGPLIRNENDPTGVIVVENQSSQAVSAVLISHCSVSTYGLNRLPRGTSIPPGSAYTFTVSAGCWDVSAGGGGGEARQRMEVAAGGGVRYTVHD